MPWLTRSIASVLLSGVVLSISVTSSVRAERTSASDTIEQGIAACDPLDTELFRCALLGAGAAADPGCQAAFACSRQRLFSPCGPDADLKAPSQKSLRHHRSRFRPK
jgi:conjugative transfer region protein TrbK